MKRAPPSVERALLVVGLEDLGRDRARLDGEEDVRVGAEVLEHLDDDVERRQLGGDRGVLEALGADAEDHGAVGRAQGRGDGKAELAEADVAVLDGGLDQVHGGRADEAGDEDVARLEVEALGRVDLQDLARAHHGDAAAEGHRLDLVVRDVDGRDAEPLVELRERRAHADAELRVEVRERLVEQEGLRLARDRAAHRDALALAAGELCGASLEQVFEPEELRHLFDPARDLRLRRLPRLEAVADVLAHRHVRVQGVGLEDHRDVAVLRRVVVMSRPPIVMRPLVTRSSPAIMRRSVDLPQPEGPTRTRNSPSSISSETSSTAVKPVNSLTMCSRWMAAIGVDGIDRMRWFKWY